MIEFIDNIIKDIIKEIKRAINRHLVSHVQVGKDKRDRIDILTEEAAFNIIRILTYKHITKMTTRDDITRWIETGKEKNATHLIVVCDTFDWEDYPVFVEEGENAKEVYDQYNGPNMQKVMEVYNLKGDIEAQLDQYRSFNFDV